MPKTVTFLPRVVAQTMTVPEDTMLLSVVHSDQEIPCHSTEWDRVEWIIFDDITQPTAGLVSFDLEHAKSIISFVEDAKAKNKNIIVHCEAGMSRSAGIAKWIGDNYDFDLFLSPLGLNTIQFANMSVYNTLDAATGKNMAAYYAAIEMNAFLNPDDE